MIFQEYIDETIQNACGVIARGDYDEILLLNTDSFVETLACDDNVTGYNCESFTHDIETAKALTADLMWDIDFLRELGMMGTTLDSIVRNGPEAVDVAARCCAIPYAREAIERAVKARLLDCR